MKDGLLSFHRQRNSVHGMSESIMSRLTIQCCLSVMSVALSLLVGPLYVTRRILGIDTRTVSGVLLDVILTAISVTVISTNHL